MTACEIVVDRESLHAKPIIALTQCEVTFDDKVDLDNCIVALKESDIRLSLRSEEETLYDWQTPIYIRGNTLYFGVRWFDRQYFQQKKEVYKDSLHEQVFSKFNAKVPDFKVQHYAAA